MDIDLKSVRTSKNVAAKDMVAVIKRMYPKYDKTVQSKCENGVMYGICLRPDAAAAIVDTFAPELKNTRKNDGHRLTCRISCRLETAEYKALQRNIQADGYGTMQDWLTAVVKRYNRRKENVTQ